MVVLGELCVHLHLFHTLHTAHDYVLISINNHRAQVEIYKAETSTEHTDHHEKKVTPYNRLLYCAFVIVILFIKFPFSRFLSLR